MPLNSPLIKTRLRMHSLALIIGCAFSNVALADQNITVMTSIKPLQLITSELTQGVTETQVLLSSSVSPHDYALRPSDIRKLNDADLFVWVGSGLESFLEKPLEGNDGSLRLDTFAQIDKIQYGDSDGHDHDGAHEDEEHHDHDHDGAHEDEEHHEHDHDGAHEDEEHYEHDHDGAHEDEEHHEHDHDGAHEDEEHHEHDHDGAHENEEHHEGHHHEHTGYDPHMWLGPDQASQIANVIYERLVEIDPEHKAQYTTNYQNFESTLASTVKDIKSELAPVKSHGYFVFHEAYSYFETYFGMNNVGHFTVSPDRKPGAKTLISIRQSLQSDNVYCVFTEPQYTPAIMNSVTKGTDVQYGVLDPLASDVKVEAGGYFSFLRELSGEYTRCLTPKS